MRNKLNQHNVENLYIKVDKRSKTGFSCQYRDPRFGLKEFGDVKQFRSLGSDVQSAIFQAKRLNAALLPKVMDNRLIDIIDSPSMASKALLMTKWLAKYTKIQLNKIESGMLKPSTWRTRKSIIVKIDSVHGHLRINSVTTKLIKEFLDTYTAQGKNRMAQSIRSLYCDIFTEAAGAGEVPSNFNPASVVKNPVSKVTKSRISLEQFNTIHAAQPYLAHQCAYMLALLTGQRRTDLCLLRKRKGSDWQDKYVAYKKNPNHFINAQEDYGSFAALVKHAPYSYIENDYLHIIQIKTGKMLKIPLGLRLEKLEMTIADVISAANIEKSSDFVLHHTTARTKCSVGEPLHPDTVSRSFKRAREAAKINWQSTPATFHEIRSLSERLYRAQGIDTQKLCGHSDKRMTDRYNDLRGTDWEEVKL
ncbi:tyrosine-type recombinase/integrase [Thalassotalea sp. ND16A]|uniref:tyrosine-type recombinase/integrase n=1 Tax=Thalassotalea sp. ND16A TaxID=1535422 RepID=UPI00051DF14C|nr:tyrosine-type recombinase/integrase [Thalassotalea sp. ND16A]KGJ99892.1 hypothetical protein ND16A_3680 [Thalassotalea sp. ND16A]